MKSGPENIVVFDGDKHAVKAGALVIRCECGTTLLTAESPAITLGALYMELWCGGCRRINKIQSTTAKIIRYRRREPRSFLRTLKSWILGGDVCQE